MTDEIQESPLKWTGLPVGFIFGALCLRNITSEATLLLPVGVNRNQEVCQSGTECPPQEGSLIVSGPLSSSLSLLAAGTSCGLRFVKTRLPDYMAVYLGRSW